MLEIICEYKKFSNNWAQQAHYVSPSAKRFSITYSGGCLIEEMAYQDLNTKN